MLCDIASRFKLGPANTFTPLKNKANGLVVNAGNTLANLVLVSELFLRVENWSLRKESILTIAKQSKELDFFLR